jgi:hypothetical protein
MPFSVQSLQFAVRTYFAARTPQMMLISPEGRPVRPQGHSANFFTVSEKV